MSEHLHTYDDHNGISAEGDFHQWGRRMIGHVIDTDKVELVKTTIWVLGDNSPFLWYRLQRSRYMKSDS